MNIVDLFTGAGGLTFGFYYRLKGNNFVRNRKNTIFFANELDEMAANSFKMNFTDINMLNCDIRELDEETVRNIIGENEIDLVIGGPPCQSYSTVGNRTFDEKAVLYEEYFRLLEIIKPKMFLFENVKGLLSMREVFYKTDNDGKIIYEYTNLENKNSKKPRRRPVVDHYGDLLIEKIKEIFKNSGNEFGYKIYEEVLNAVDFGIPENRERVFIVGIRKDIKNLSWEFPKPTDNKPISIKDAISDFTPIGEGDESNEYCCEPQNEYQKLMRNNSKRVTHHCCGVYGEKIRTVIRNVGQGQGINDFNNLVDSGKIDEKFKLTSGYPNTYGRLLENRPSPTITNNLSTPSALRCIHYSQDRALTSREGARIQSFPDWFDFCGGKNDVNTQIGNAVPPLLAIHLAKQFEKALG